MAAVELLERLRQYGKEWRESKLPPTVRATGIHTCHIAVEEPAFTLRLEPQGRGPQLQWVGEVAPSDADDGSVIIVCSRQTRLSRASEIVLVILLSAIWWPFIRGGDLAFPIAGGFVMGLSTVGAIAWRSARQATQCQAILSLVAGAKSIASVRAT